MTISTQSKNDCQIMPASKIKICIIIPGLKCGGSERFISILCNHINTAAFDVELYILDGEDPFYQITNPGVKVFPLNIKNVRKSLFPLLKIIRKTNPDILFTVSNHLNIYIAIFKFLFPRKIKVIARETSIVSINNKRSEYGKLYEWIVMKFYKNIDYVICQSAYMQNDLVINYKIKRENTVVIHNPVEEFTFPGNDNRMQSKKLPIYKFFTVARLSAEKGVDRLIKALALMDIDFSFHIIGDGPEKLNLQEITKQLNMQHKVIFEGTKSNPYENMSDADLFLIGSYFEGFPNVLLEAGILGIPVVGFKAPGGIAEIIVEGINGFLVNDDDGGESFKNTVITALNYNFNRQQIIEVTKSSFLVKKIMKQLENYFSQIHHGHFEDRN